VERDGVVRLFVRDVLAREPLGGRERQSWIMRQSLAIVIAVLALAACTGSSLTGSAQAQLPGSEAGVQSPFLSPPPLSKPRGCPSETSYSRILHRNDVPGTDDQLVPGQPDVLVECLPSRRVVIGDGSVVAKIVDELNALKLVDPAVYSCPADFGPTYGLFFNYSNGDVLLVTVDASGCRFASNGTRSAFTTDVVRERIEHPRRP
jgi:hypothetical protein